MIGEREAVITSECNMPYVREWLITHVQMKVIRLVDEQRGGNE
jgi:hypothetical protein